MTPEQYLQTKDFKLRSAPGEWQTQCPFCGDKNKYGHLYVNQEHGAFICHRCGEKGSFYNLQTKLGDKPEPNVKMLSDKWSVWADVVEICQDALLETPHALEYLKYERGLTPHSIGNHRLGWVPRNLIDQLLKRWTMTDIRHAGLVNDESRQLFWDRILIPYYHRDHVVTLRGKQIGGNVLQVKDTSIYLYGADRIRGHAEVYICEGEFDAIYLSQLGYPTCAIPGALSYQEHWNTYFEAARRVFICLDTDETGRRGAQKVHGYLGKRGRIVDLPSPQSVKSTDITEYFMRDGHTKDQFDDLIEKARGRRVFTFSDAIQDRNDLLRLEGLRLGWRDLDYAIHPGLLPGQVATVLAKTGAGKTALLTQICHNLSAWQAYGDSDGVGPAIPTLVLSLEQTKAEIGNRLERIGRLYNPYASVEEMNRWYCNMRIVDENRIPPGDVPVLVEEFVEDVGLPPRLIVVDYLGYWSRSFKGNSKYEQTSEAIMELKRFAKELNAAIIAPHQVSRLGKKGERIEMDTARDSGVVEETSDFVFGLFRPGTDKEDDESEDFRSRAEVRLEVLKSRHGNVGRQVVMVWAPYSLATVPRGEFDRKVQNEWMLYDSQAMYEDVLEVHRGGAGQQLAL